MAFIAACRLLPPEPDPAILRTAPPGPPIQDAASFCPNKETDGNLYRIAGLRAPPNTLINLPKVTNKAICSASPNACTVYASPSLMFPNKMKSGWLSHQVVNGAPAEWSKGDSTARLELIPSSDRVDFVDALRFIMCIGIAIYHFTPYFFSENDIEYVISLFFSYFTDIFFLLSGFLAAKTSLDRFSKSGKHSFSSLRAWFSRVYPLHIVTFSFYLAIFLLNRFWLHGLISSGRYDGQNILPNVLLLHAVGFGDGLSFNYPSWAISAIFWSYCLFLFAAPLHGFEATRLFCLLLVCIAIALVIQQAEAVSLSKLQEINLGFIRALPSFLLGAVLFRCPKPKVTDGVALMLLGAAMLLLFAHPAPLLGITRDLTIGLAFYVLLIAHHSGSRLLRLLAPLQRWGKVSFGVYLFHGVVATIFIRVLLEGDFGDLHQLADHHRAAAYLAILIALGISVGLALASRPALEKAGTALNSWLEAHFRVSMRGASRFF